jgi:heat shock protein HslJ
MKHNWLHAMILVMVGVILAACGPTGASGEPTVDQTEVPANQEAEMTVAGVDWALHSYTNATGAMVAALTDGRVTARFEGGQVGGTAGCNHYGGPALIDGNGLVIGPLASTLMACLEPDGVMAQEQAFLAHLEKAASFGFDGRQLVLKDVDGQELLRFDVVEPVELIGSAWLATGYNNGRGVVVSVLSATEGQLTAVFGEDGQVTGSAGCNDYFASYTAGDGTLTIGPAGATKKLCLEPEGVMEQETEFLVALSQAATFRIDGSQMEIRSADGELLVSLVIQ